MLSSLRILKYEWRPLMKPVWSFEIIVGKTVLSLQARILAKILPSVFRREMGLYEAHSIGSFPFFP